MRADPLKGCGWLFLFGIGLGLSPSAVAKPSWANLPDSASASGHRFICEGHGKTDPEALAAALNACNEKICKLCGVEIETSTETHETTKSVELSHKIIERCRRVRKSEPKVSFKSIECGPDGCDAWVDLSYPKEDERNECPSYAKENFADPSACEKSIDDFGKIVELTADSFRARAALLTQAISQCAEIDVRPTPAMMALDSKLHKGLGSVSGARSYAARYLVVPSSLSTQIAESKSWVDRLRLVRDYFANKALVFDVIEAIEGDTKTAAGLAKLLQTLKKAPVGRQYDAPNVQIDAVTSLYRVPVDVSAINAFIRTTYPADKVDAEYGFRLANFFKDDAKTTQEEWDYIYSFHLRHPCVHCMRQLLAAPDHESDDRREKRFFQALAAQPVFTKEGGKVPGDLPPTARYVRQIAPMADPRFLAEIFPKLPKALRDSLDWDFYGDVVSRLDKKKQTKEEQKGFLRLAVDYLATRQPAAQERSFCIAFADRIHRLEEWTSDLGPLDAQICRCLSVGLASEPEYLVNKSELRDRAEKRKLKCK